MPKETTKIERILRLILFLNVSFPRSRQECLDYLNISESTFFEYLKLLRNSGFDIKQEGGQYWLDLLNSENDLIARLLHFTEEEAYLIAKAIRKLDVSLPVAARLYRKLASLVDNDELLSKAARKQSSEIISSLGKAIQQKKQVILINYASGNSLTIKNRRVEPFEFKYEFKLLWAYDVEERACRQFKISRIEEVEIINLNWEHEEKHRCLPTDIFRNTGKLVYGVKISMSLRAYNLLIEEYPLAEKYCRKQTDSLYSLEVRLARLEGISRFILGLSGEITTIEGGELLKFLKKKAGMLQKKFLTPGIPD